MGYLKALGLFRLVAEQADKAARLSWANGVAVLHSTLDRGGLTDFFLNAYRPTPMFSPWSGGSGFYRTWDQKAGRLRSREAVDCVEYLRSSVSERLTPYRSVLKQVDFALTQYAKTLNVREMEEKVRKSTLLLSESQGIFDADQPNLQPYLRANLPDEALDWLDTVILLQEDFVRAAPLFISGGNDGNFDFSVTFIACVQRVLSDPKTCNNQLEACIYSGKISSLDKGTAGHFNPGGKGGPNGSQGFEGCGGVNPWDFILMIEGAVMLAGAVSRKLGTQTGDKASFPFAVSPVATNFGSAAPGDESSDTCRTELWLPLWSRTATLPELRRLFSEGRAQIGRRQARNAVDFALATCLLGVSRGIDSFVRFGFLRRSGKMFLAAPLGRVTVTPRPQARLLDDPPLRDWVDRLRRACNDKDKTPARYQAALRDIDRATFAFAVRSQQDNDAPYLMDVLRALGRAERTLAKGLAFCADKFIRPLSGLSADWLKLADDGSDVFGLAASLAGVRGEGKVGPMRAFLEEVEAAKFVNWSPGSTSAVWSNRPLADNLAAVFRRRQMEAFRAGGHDTPAKHKRPARLDDVLAFLAGDTDDDKLSDLLWGLIAVDWRKAERTQTVRGVGPVPYAFGVPRLVVKPLAYRGRRVPDSERCAWTIDRDAEAGVKADAGAFDRLAAGRPDAVADCVTHAAGRLKSGGLLVGGYRNRGRAGKGLDIPQCFDPTRLLAAMLFPLPNRDLVRIANAVLSPPESEE